MRKPINLHSTTPAPGWAPSQSKAVYREELEKLLSDLDKEGREQWHEGNLSIAVDVSTKGDKKYRSVSFLVLYDQFQNLFPQRAHEVNFPADDPCATGGTRAVVDFEKKEVMTADELQQAIDIIVMEFSKADCSVSRDKILVLYCYRQPGALEYPKTSVHIIWDDDRHWASMAHFFAYCEYRGVDWEKLKKMGVDTQIYKAGGGTLRAIGSVKAAEMTSANLIHYQDCMPPLFTPDVGKQITLPIFKRYFHTYIPEGSIKVHFAMEKRKGGKYKAANELADNRFVQLALADIQKRNPDAEIKKVVRCEDRPHVILVDWKGAKNCASKQHANNEMSSTVDTRREVAMHRCPWDGTCSDTIVPLTQRGAYLEALVPMLDYLAEKNLDRVDMPLFESEFGGRDITPDYFGPRFAELFVPFQKAEGMDTPWDLKVWEFLCGDNYAFCNHRRLITYFNLFFNINEKSMLIVVRKMNPTEYLASSAANKVKDTTAAGFQVPTYKEGKKDEPPKKVMVAFFPIWNKDPDRRVFTNTRNGHFSLKSGRGPLNTSVPKAFDTNECVRCYADLEEPKKELLRKSWMRYLEIIVGNEHPHLKKKAAEFFERWCLENVFQVGIKIMITVGLISKDHGVGKSWIGDLISVILGPSLVAKPSALEELKAQFASWANKPFVFCDEVAADLKKLSTAAMMKERTTGKTGMVEHKQGNKEIVDNISNYLMTGNDVNGNGALIPGTSKNSNRRNFVEEPLSLDQQNELFERSPLICKHPDCRRDVMNDYNCGHCLTTRADFWKFMQLAIVGASNGEPGPALKPFIGFLHSRFQHYASQNPPKLAQSLIQTRMVEVHQQTMASPVEKWYDEKIAAGCYFERDNPLWQGTTILMLETWSLVPKDYSSRKRKPCNMREPCSAVDPCPIHFLDEWEEDVPKETLYRCFTVDLMAKKIAIPDMDEFFGELTQILVERGASPTQSLVELKSCKYWLCQKEAKAAEKDKRGRQEQWIVKGTKKNVPCFKFKQYTRNDAPIPIRVANTSHIDDLISSFGSISRSSLIGHVEDDPIPYNTSPPEIGGSFFDDFELEPMPQDEDAQDGFEPIVVDTCVRCGETRDVCCCFDFITEKLQPAKKKSVDQPLRSALQRAISDVLEADKEVQHQLSMSRAATIVDVEEPEMELEDEEEEASPTGLATFIDTVAEECSQNSEASSEHMPILASSDGATHSLLRLKKRRQDDDKGKEELSPSIELSL